MGHFCPTKLVQFIRGVSQSICYKVYDLSICSIHNITQRPVEFPTSLLFLLIKSFEQTSWFDARRKKYCINSQGEPEKQREPHYFSLHAKRDKSTRSIVLPIPFVHHETDSRWSDNVFFMQSDYEYPTWVAPRT